MVLDHIKFHLPKTKKMTQKHFEENWGLGISENHGRIWIKIRALKKADMNTFYCKKPF